MLCPAPSLCCLGLNLGLLVDTSLATTSVLLLLSVGGPWGTPSAICGNWN